MRHYRISYRRKVGGAILELIRIVEDVEDF
jgi:hypothetical protein